MSGEDILKYIITVYACPNTSLPCTILKVFLDGASKEIGVKFQILLSMRARGSQSSAWDSTYTVEHVRV